MRSRAWHTIGPKHPSGAPGLLLATHSHDRWLLRRPDGPRFPWDSSSRRGETAHADRSSGGPTSPTSNSFLRPLDPFQFSKATTYSSWKGKQALSAVSMHVWERLPPSAGRIRIPGHMFDISTDPMRGQKAAGAPRVNAYREKILPSRHVFPPPAAQRRPFSPSNQSDRTQYVRVVSACYRLQISRLYTETKQLAVAA
jgi:hypothetical protein